jgi:hypothetical protein
MNVFLEALLVGLFFLPVYWVVEKAGFSKWVTLFAAGFVFHLVAEVTGVNRAYVLTKV